MNAAGNSLSRLSAGWIDLARLAVPVILSRLGIMTMGLTDTIVVGRHAADQLAFHALAWAPTMVVLTTSVGLLTGIQVMTARRLGEGRPEAAGGVLRDGLVLAFAIGLGSALLLFFGSGPFLDAIGLDAALARGATAAAQVLALSMLPYLLSVALTFWLEALGRAGMASLLMWGANLLNLALNLWLVPGTHVPGIDGAVASAWATFGARTALLGMLALYVWRWPQAAQHGLWQRSSPTGSDMPQLWRIGLAAAGSLFVETTAFAGMNVVAGWLGALETASWAIVLNVAALVFMVPLGLSSATAVLVGHAYGADDKHGVVAAGLRGFISAVAILTLICLAVWLGADRIAAAYTRDLAVQALVVPALILSCLFFITDGLQVIAANALRARNDVWLPTATHVFSYAFVMLPLGWALAHPLHGGINGIVWAAIIASLLSAALLLGRFGWLARETPSAGARAAAD